MRESLEAEFVTLADVLETHEEMINAIGGSHGLKDMGSLESAIAQPQMTFGGFSFTTFLRCCCKNWLSPPSTWPHSTKK